MFTLAAARLARLLASRHMLWLAPLAAVLLCSTSLNSGMQTEDHVHRAMARSSLGSVLWMFGAPQDSVMANYHAMDHGALPWITSTDWRVAFWRPVAAATHVLDYRLWPNHPAAMHAHTLLWLGLLVHGVARLFRALIPSPTVAGLAALLYAVNDGHGTAVGWLANRNVVVATGFSVLALLLYHRARQKPRWPTYAAASVSLWLGLSAGEAAVGIVGFLIAYVVHVDDAPWRARLAAVSPMVASFLLWAIPYVALGYGTHNSGIYLDPFDEPTQFLHAVALRAPGFWFGLFGFISLDALPFLNAAFSTPLTIFGLVWFVVVLAVLVAQWRRTPSSRFWLTGAAIALIPACTAPPGERILFVADLGASPLIATVMLTAITGARSLSAGGRASARVVAAGWFVSNLLLAAPLLMLKARGLRRYDAAVNALAREAFSGSRADQQLVIVNANDFYSGILLHGIGSQLKPHPRFARTLYGGTETITVRRRSPVTLAICAPGGFMSSPMNRVYRGFSDRMRPGQGLQLTGMRFIVTEVDEQGMPRCVDFHFARRLESPRLRFVVWQDDHYVAFEPPPLGHEVQIPPGELPGVSW